MTNPYLLNESTNSDKKKFAISIYISSRVSCISLNELDAIRIFTIFIISITRFELFAGVPFVALQTVWHLINLRKCKKHAMICIC